MGFYVGQLGPRLHRPRSDAAVRGVGPVEHCRVLSFSTSLSPPLFLDLSFSTSLSLPLFLNLSPSLSLRASMPSRRVIQQVIQQGVGPRHPLLATVGRCGLDKRLAHLPPPQTPTGTERTANQRHVAYDTRRGNGGRAVLQPLRRLAKEGLARAACVYYASKKCRRLQLTTRSLRRPARTRGGHSVGWHG